MNRVIKFDRSMVVRNLDALPRGLGKRARFLECIEGMNGEFVAQQWRTKLPATFEICLDLS